jgi:hypothetical protein
MQEPTDNPMKILPPDQMGRCRNVAQRPWAPGHRRDHHGMLGLWQVLECCAPAAPAPFSGGTLLVDNSHPMDNILEQYKFICSPFDTPKGLGRGYFLCYAH